MNLDERKILIANTFETTFNQVGFKKTTVEGIAKKLSMSKKTIYKYFTSKDDAFKFLVERYAKIQVEEIKSDINNIDDYWDKLKIINKICFNKVNDAILKGEKDEFSFFYPDKISVKAFQSAYREMVTEILISGINNKIFNVPDVDLYLIFIESIIANGIENIKSHPIKDIEEYTYNAVVKLLK